MPPSAVEVRFLIYEMKVFKAESSVLNSPSLLIHLMCLKVCAQFPYTLCEGLLSFPHKVSEVLF